MERDIPSTDLTLFEGDPDAHGVRRALVAAHYQGPEDLDQPQDPSIAVSASQGTADAVTVFPSPSDRPASVEVGATPA